MNPKLQSALKYLIFLGIGGTLFYLAFRNTEWDKLVSDFRRANYWYVLASMIMGWLAFVSRGFRWVYLIEPMGFKVNKWNSVHSVTVGYFTNSLIPRAGEVARCTALNQTDKVPVDKLFGTVVVERLVDLLMMILLLGVVLITEYDTVLNFWTETMQSEGGNVDESSNNLAIKIFVAALIFGGILMFYFFRRKFSHHPIYHKVRGFWHGFKDGLKSFKNLENKGAFIFHTLFIWTMYFVMSYIVVFALPATSGLSPSEGLFVVLVGALGILAPSPGGIGTFHYFAMVGMGIVGVAAADGLSFATLVHGGQTIMTVIAGLVSTAALVRIRRRRKKRGLAELGNEGQEV